MNVAERHFEQIDLARCERPVPFAFCCRHVPLAGTGPLCLGHSTSGACVNSDRYSGILERGQHE